MRLTVAIVAALGCGRAPHPATPPVARPVTKAQCFEMYAERTADLPLDCVHPGDDARSMIVAPGRIRVLFTFAVPGVPAPIDNGNVFVVDVTPAGRELVATGSCPGDGRAILLASDAAGATHVLCERPSGRDHNASVLDDVRVDAGKLVAARPPLTAPWGEYAALALPARGTPIVLFRRGHNDESLFGPLEALAWLPGAAPFELKSTDGELVDDDEEPAAVLVGRDAVRVVVRAWHDGVVEVDARGARDLGQLTGAPCKSSCDRWSLIDDGALQLVGVDDAEGDAPRTACAALPDLHAAAGPDALGPPERLCRAPDELDASDRKTRIACDAAGCVATYVAFDHDELRVVRWR